MKTRVTGYEAFAAELRRANEEVGFDPATYVTPADVVAIQERLAAKARSADATNIDAPAGTTGQVAPSLHTNTIPGPLSSVTQPKASRAPQWVHDLAAAKDELNAMPLMDAAVWYASHGIPVFPQVVGDKKPLTTHGYFDATTDLTKVRRWWGNTPNANIGIPTGDLCAVLDPDHKNGAALGLTSLQKVKKAGLLVPAFAVSATPTGGFHILFAPSLERTHLAPQQGDPRDKGSKGHGIDYKAKGGAFTVAPSVFEGVRYRWVDVNPDRYGDPFDWEAMDRLLQPWRYHATGVALPKGRMTKGVLARRLDALAAMGPNSGRNAETFALACSALRLGIDLEVVRESAMESGLDSNEVNSVFKSARHAVETEAMLKGEGR